MKVRRLQVPAVSALLALSFAAVPAAWANPGDAIGKTASSVTVWLEHEDSVYGTSIAQQQKFRRRIQNRSSERWTDACIGA